MRGWLRLPALRLGAYPTPHAAASGPRSRRRRDPRDHERIGFRRRRPGRRVRPRRTACGGRDQGGPRRLVDDGDRSALSSDRRKRSPAWTSACAATRAGATRMRQGSGRNRSPSCNATASTDASPMTRSISNRTAVERSGMSPPAAIARSPEASSNPRDSPASGPSPSRASRTNRAAAPIGIDGSGRSGAITTPTSWHTSPSRNTA